MTDSTQRTPVVTIPYAALRKKWDKDPEFLKERAALKPEFQLARELIEARVNAGLSQQEVAEKMGPSQPTVARLESGHHPSLRSLQRYAEATGSKLEIRLVST